MSVSENKVWVLIPAAGVGSRMQSAIPKQYLSLHGSTILEHTLNCFISMEEVAGIVVVVSKEDDYWASLLKGSELLSHSHIPIHTAIGGEDRASTVKNGLVYLSNHLGLEDNQWVMVHDAARPCVSQKDLTSLLAVREVAGFDGGILAYRVKDTMKRAKLSSCEIDLTESRDDLWHALTPQLFKLKELEGALVAAQLDGHQVTDEASAMEFCGKQVALVEGASDNIKLTAPSDLKLIEFLLNREE